MVRDPSTSSGQARLLRMTPILKSRLRDWWFRPWADRPPMLEVLRGGRGEPGR
jgi:hypothetical protein